MLTVVRAADNASAVERRLTGQADRLAALAAAPVRHVPTAFLAAVAGLFPELLEIKDRRREAR